MSAYHASRVDALRAELAQLIERVSAGATDGDAGALAHVAVLADGIERELDALAVALLELPARPVVGEVCARCKGPGPLAACTCAWRVEGQDGGAGTREGYLHERLCRSCSGELVAVVGIASSGAPGDAGGGACG
jgi:hypothetical protein